MANMFDEIGELVAGHLDGAQKELREATEKGGSLTQNDFPEGEKKKAWRKMKALPPDQFQVVAESLANKSGHVDGEQEPCDFHAFMQEMIGS